eukprot:15611319-Heterocapsa_arctica.AAC.1
MSSAPRRTPSKLESVKITTLPQRNYREAERVSIQFLCPIPNGRSQPEETIWNSSVYRQVLCKGIQH